MTSLPGNVRQMSPDQAHPSLCRSMDNAPVPSTVHAPSTYGLPPVNHDQALKRQNSIHWPWRHICLLQPAYERIGTIRNLPDPS